MSVALCMFSSVTKCSAQQEWAYSQYLFNLFDINSAYAGNHNNLSFALRYRKQWTGFDGAPQTQSFSFHTPVVNASWASGVKLQHETIGARKQVRAKASFAHKWRVGSGKLSAALSGGVVRQEMLLSDLNIRDEYDPITQVGNWTGTSPVADVAVMYTSDKMYLGVESSGANRSRFNWNEQSHARLYYHVYTTGGWMKKVGARNLLQLSALAKFSEGNIYQAEADVSFLFQNILWLGAGYRPGYGAVCFVELNVSAQFRMGYAFDYATNSLKNYHRGSHEFFLGFNLGSSANPSIRYF